LAVDGFGENNLLGIIAETGVDMTQWKTEKHFTSWLRLSPNNKISGGKIISQHTRKTNSRANKLFRLAAQSLLKLLWQPPENWPLSFIEWFVLKSNITISAPNNMK